MNILYLAHRIPYPPNKGDKIRSYNEIKYLSQHCNVDLACLADSSQDIKYKKNLEKYCREVVVVLLEKIQKTVKASFSLFSGSPFSVAFFYSKKLQKCVNEMLANNSYDAVICFSSVMAEYVYRSPIFKANESSRSHLRKQTLIMDFCDVDSDKWRQYAKRAMFPINLIYKMESKRLLEYEKNVNEHFDYSVFISREEAGLFMKLFPGARNACVIPNGVDYNYFRPGACKNLRLKRPHRTVLLFTGAMDYYANVDGVSWFCNHVYPLINRKNSDVSFYIVGNNPVKRVKALATNDDIVVTGFVKDIRPYYDMAEVYVAPLRLARGVQNKILEAMSMEKAVVTTSNALEGISAKPGRHLLVADGPEEFADAVVFLLNDAEEKRLMGLRAREFVKSNYDWFSKMKMFDKLLSKN